MSKSGTGSSVALGREMEGDSSAIPTALLQFSPGITGQNWLVTDAALFGRGNSPVHLPLKVSSRNSESTQARCT